MELATVVVGENLIEVYSSKVHFSKETVAGIMDECCGESGA